MGTLNPPRDRARMEQRTMPLEQKEALTEVARAVRVHLTDPAEGRPRVDRAVQAALGAGLPPRIVAAMVDGAASRFAVGLRV